MNTEFAHCLLALLMQVDENQRLRDLRQEENVQKRRELEELAAKELNDATTTKRNQLERARNNRQMIENQIAEKYDKKQRDREVRKYEKSDRKKSHTRTKRVVAALPSPLLLPSSILAPIENVNEFLFLKRILPKT